MPINEYQCKNCQHVLELIQKFSDKNIKKCPKCSKNSLMKIISSSAFHLKGHGWTQKFRR